MLRRPPPTYLAWWSVRILNARNAMHVCFAPHFESTWYDLMPVLVGYKFTVGDTKHVKFVQPLLGPGIGLNTLILNRESICRVRKSKTKVLTISRLLDWNICWLKPLVLFVHGMLRNITLINLGHVVGKTWNPPIKFTGFVLGQLSYKCCVWCHAAERRRLFGHAAANFGYCGGVHHCIWVSVLSSGEWELNWNREIVLRWFGDVTG